MLVDTKRHAALTTRIVAFSITLFAASQASAVPMIFSGLSSDGHPVSAIADFILNDATDTVSVTLNNTTTTTLDAGELFTGLDFTISGLTPTLTSDTGIQRTVDFTPGANDGIIGAPTAGSYATANGSIKGNAGHNPFAAEEAEFELSVPGLGPDSIVELLVFRYGTTLQPATGTITPMPEPASLALAGIGLVAMAAQRRRRQ
jgi:hypothetical protein